MNNLNLWSINIVTVSVISSILKLLVPDTKLSSGVIFGINLFVVLAIISPLSNGGKISIDLELEEIEPIVFSAEEYTLNETLKTLEENISSKLLELGINIDTTVIDISMGDKDNLQIIITIEESEKVEEIRSELEEYLEMDITVMAKEEQS